ncbi:MAG: sigma-70 family RNA polymerase sigma factor, partial [bacterium]|nr:sigma-70 family RNA polymerase sigma factor [bacterium]
MAKFETTSDTLLGRVRQGGRQAWGRLVELYAPLVRYWCRRSGLSDEDTADIFQETFQAVARKIEEFDRIVGSGAFRGWLRTITLNKIRDLARKQKRQAIASGGTDAQLRLQQTPDLTITDDVGDEETSLMQAAVRRALDWIRDDFNESTWQAFWLC